MHYMTNMHVGILPIKRSSDDDNDDNEDDDDHYYDDDKEEMFVFKCDRFCGSQIRLTQLSKTNTSTEELATTHTISFSSSIYSYQETDTVFKEYETYRCPTFEDKQISSNNESFLSATPRQF